MGMFFNVLRLCNIYGENFHWYIGYKPKYYTLCGGILSLLSFLLIVIILIFFGYDDFSAVQEAM